MENTVYLHTLLSTRDIGMRYHKEVIYQRSIRADRLKKGVLLVEKVTVASHGFDGYIGFCQGHEWLIKKGIQAARDQPSYQTSSDMLSFFQQAAAHGMSATAAMEEWQEKNRTTPSVVSVQTSGDNSTVSTITSPPSPVCNVMLVQATYPQCLTEFPFPFCICR